MSRNADLDFATFQSGVFVDGSATSAPCSTTS